VFIGAQADQGILQAPQDLQIDRAYVIAPVLHQYPLAEGVEVIPVGAVPTVLAR